MNCCTISFYNVIFMFGIKRKVRGQFFDFLIKLLFLGLSIANLTQGYLNHVYKLYNYT